jgi:thioredoxin 1
MPLPVITEIKDRNHFMDIIKTNPGIIIMKFGAKWCGPCQIIEKDLEYTFAVLPDTVQCMNIDIDLYPDVYSFLKAKRIVNGIPVLLCYKKGNNTYVPDDIVIGADKTAIRDFFTRAMTMLK